MESFTYKGISAGKYIEGEIEALNQEEASHKLKEQKVIITNLVRAKKKKGEKKTKKGGGFSFGKKKKSTSSQSGLEKETPEETPKKPMKASVVGQKKQKPMA